MMIQIIKKKYIIIFTHNKTMNRCNRRYQKQDLSTLQPGLRIMHEGCDGLLHKSGLLDDEQKTTNYLMLTRIHNLNRSMHDSSGNNIKMMRSIENQKQTNPFDDQKLQPLFSSQIQKGQLDRPTRIYNKKFNKHYLPTIYPSKSSTQNQNMRGDLNQNTIDGKNLQIPHGQINNDYLGDQRNYYSIDLNRQSDAQNQSNPHHTKTRQTSKTNSKGFETNLKKKYSLSEELVEPPSPLLRRQRSSEREKSKRQRVEYFKMPSICSKLIIKQRTQSIIKRQLMHNLRKQEELYYQYTHNHQTKKHNNKHNSSNKESAHPKQPQQSQYCPWSQQKNVNQLELLQDGQLF